MRSLKEIKRLRKKYGLSQKELAFNSGVSQSLIAKIESGKVEPTYIKAVDLFKSLDSFRKTKDISAKDIMTTKILTVTSDTLLLDAIKLMKKHDISQIPVFNDGVVCGLISESIIVEKTLELDGKISNLSVEHVMGDSPPIISASASFRTILELLCDSSIVLVSTKGKLKGIIAKTDVLGRVE